MKRMIVVQISADQLELLRRGGSVELEDSRLRLLAVAERGADRIRPNLDRLPGRTCMFRSLIEERS